MTINSLLKDLNNLWNECITAAAIAKSPDRQDLSASAAAMWERAADEISRSIRQIECAKASHEKAA